MTSPSLTDILKETGSILKQAGRQTLRGVRGAICGGLLLYAIPTASRKFDADSYSLEGAELESAGYRLGFGTNLIILGVSSIDSIFSYAVQGSLAFEKPTSILSTLAGPAPILAALAGNTILGAYELIRQRVVNKAESVSRSW
ncbi:hypothetical protein HYY73_06440 [Candidatus Woesearchaeota archaeon]|nr:hypothetical protein [Candidatus Woesearchaeota archaeon]